MAPVYASVYLDIGQAARYGLLTVTDAEIADASALIDAYLNRPEGLVWSPDANGLPCFMTAQAPTFTFELIADIAPGAGVSVQLNGPTAMLNVGDVLVLDPDTNGTCEACVVSAAPSAGGSALTLQTVLNAHSAAAVVHAGRLIEEQRTLPSKRPLTRASRTPLMRIVSGTGRYAFQRRGDAGNDLLEEFNLLASLDRFGGPPAWELWQTFLNNWDQNTGQIWVPSGVMLAYYTEVKYRYVAGFPATALPEQIKRATAKLIVAKRSAPPLGGNVKSFKAADTSLSMFSASLLDDDTKAQLRPYAAKAMA